MDSAEDEDPRKCSEHGRVRWRVGDFLLASLRGQNSARYLQAVEMFQRELRSRGRELAEVSEDEVDYALADHLLDLHETYNDTSGLGHAGLLVAAVSKVLPRPRLKVAWKVLDAWRVRFRLDKRRRFLPSWPSRSSLGCSPLASRSAHA